MDVLRIVDAYCTSCMDVRTHAVPVDDPGACYCNECGAAQPLVHPIEVSVRPVVRPRPSTPSRQLLA